MSQIPTRLEWGAVGCGGPELARISRPSENVARVVIRNRTLATIRIIIEDRRGTELKELAQIASMETGVVDIERPAGEDAYVIARDWRTSLSAGDPRSSHVPTAVSARNGIAKGRLNYYARFGYGLVSEVDIVWR